MECIKFWPHLLDTLGFPIFFRGVDYIFTLNNLRGLALRGKEFHLTPTPFQDSRCTFLCVRGLAQD
nr:MAG TPA: hypothetical protein [Caudoviricetes sp.]